MVWIDRVCAGLLILVGCVHNFVAAPMVIDRLDERGLWFLAGGLVLWLGGLINIVWLLRRAELWWAALIANSLMLAFALAFSAISGWGTPQGSALLAVLGWLTARSGLAARRR
jgi:hypothetical protein